MFTALLRTVEAGWSEFLALARTDIYYLPGYVTLCARQEGGEPLLFVAREAGNLWILPLVLRPIPFHLACGDRLFDAISPYGYSGPLIKLEEDSDAAAWVERAAEATRVALAGRGVVSLFVRGHPLHPAALCHLASHGDVVRQGETVVVDLTQSSEALWSQMRKGHRTEIRSLQRDGFVARMDADFRRFGVFRSIYEETMRRVGADEQYFFDESYYTGLRRALGDHLHLCTVEHDDTIVCAGLFAEMDGIIQYHLSGTAASYLHYHPTKLMLYYVSEWGRQRGNQLFHLGGGVGAAADSLFQFKRGFSKQTAPFDSWRLVVDQKAYDRLVRRRHALAGNGMEVDSYFPAYRHGLPAITRRRSHEARAASRGTS